MRPKSGWDLEQPPPGPGTPPIQTVPSPVCQLQSLRGTGLTEQSGVELEGLGAGLQARRLRGEVEADPGASDSGAHQKQG